MQESAVRMGCHNRDIRCEDLGRASEVEGRKSRTLLHSGPYGEDCFVPVNAEASVGAGVGMGCRLGNRRVVVLGQRDLDAAAHRVSGLTGLTGEDGSCFRSAA